MAIREQSDQRKGDIKIVRIEGDKEQELTVRHEAVLPERREVDLEMA
jgi:hypothetical protein